MPFLTEELWHRRGHETSIALAAYPDADPAWDDPDAELEMEVIVLARTADRANRAAANVARKEFVQGVNWYETDLRKFEIARRYRPLIESGNNASFVLHNFPRPAGSNNVVYSTATSDYEYPFPPAVDNRERLIRESADLEKVIANSKRQLENGDFVSKAPAKVIDGMRRKLAEYEAQLAKNKAALGE